MRLFGSDRIATLMGKMGLEEDEELEHPLLNRSIETAQKRIEQHHFAIRRRTLEYDDVMNKQREVLYGFRKDILLSDNPREILFDILSQEIETKVDEACECAGKVTVSFDKEILLSRLNSVFPLGFTSKDIPQGGEDGIPDRDSCVKKIIAKIEEAYRAKEALETPESLRWLEKNIMLEAVDRLWQDHLYAMDHLRSSVGLRAYAQKNPLVEYKHEAYEIFSELMASINREILTNMFRSATSLAAFEQILSSLPQRLIHDQLEQFGTVSDENSGHPPKEDGQNTRPAAEDIKITFVRNAPRVGRNEQCPCGSGKKYKKCCGK
jgi:preprotein translocase subunit SecA